MFRSCNWLIVDVGFVYFASYTYFTSTYFPKMPSYGKCAGEEFAAFAGMGILSSYLLLFISFYFATYKKTGQRGRKRSGTATRAAIDMSKMEIPSVNSAKSAKSQANGSLANGSLANGSLANGSLANGSLANGFLANGHATANGNAITPGTNANGRVTRSRKA